MKAINLLKYKPSDRYVEAMYTGLNLKIFTIPSSERWWVNPCIPYNIGFKHATGDIIIIQNPECLHVGDVISHAVNSINDSSYITYSVVAIIDSNVNQMNRIRELRVDKLFEQNVNSVIDVNHINNTDVINKNHWYNHPIYRPRHFHFLSAITNDNLKSIGGFNEEYALGAAWDDADFVVRIQRMGLKMFIVPPNVVYGIHQPHNFITKVRRRVTKDLMQINEKIFEKMITGIGNE
jgi:hypothetical protein